MEAERVKLSLEQLVALINDGNKYPEIDWGDPVGKELW